MFYKNFQGISYMEKITHYYEKNGENYYPKLKFKRENQPTQTVKHSCAFATKQAALKYANIWKNACLKVGFIVDFDLI